MKSIDYLDCYASVGKWPAKDPAAPWTVGKMLDDMKRCGIHGALVYSNFARDLEPSVGNEIVSEICEENPRLFPCWVALPHTGGEAPSGSEFVKIARSRGVRAVKIFPKLHHFLVNKRTLGDLLEALESAQMPLIVDAGHYEPYNQITWSEVEWLAASYPTLPILLHSVRWEATRFLLPLLQEFPNLHVEFSNYQANRIIEFLVERVGANQLLFGTEMMQKSPGAAKAFVDYADISEDDRRKIAGENLMRLLKISEPPAHYEDFPQDAILSQAKKGAPILDMEVIDGHAHISEKGHSDIVIAVMPHADAAGVVVRNARLGVDKTCVSGWAGVWSDYALGNETVGQAIRDFPEQIVGYATLDPLYVEDWDKELHNCYEELGMQGMKPYFPRNKIPYNDKSYEKWFTYGNEHRLFALMHPSDNFTVEMEDLAARYPEISFLLAHSGWSYEVARRHAALAQKFPNVYCEITFTSVTNGIIEFLVQEVGSEKVIYGSDTSMRDPIPQFGWVAYADISEKDKRNILGRNMRRILNRVQT